MSSILEKELYIFPSEPFQMENEMLSLSRDRTLLKAQHLFIVDHSAPPSPPPPPSFLPSPTPCPVLLPPRPPLLLPMSSLRKPVDENSSISCENLSGAAVGSQSVSQCIYMQSIFSVSSLFGFLAQSEVSPFGMQLRNSNC